MDTIPSIKDLHAAACSSTRNNRRNRPTEDEDEEQMDALFEEEKDTNLSTLSSGADGSTVWTSGFEEHGDGTPETTLTADGAHKSVPKPDDKDSHVSSSFPHMHQPLKHHHHHHKRHHNHQQHHHHKRRRRSLSPSTSPLHGIDEDDASVATAAGAEGEGDAGETTDLQQPVAQKSPVESVSPATTTSSSTTTQTTLISPSASVTPPSTTPQPSPADAAASSPYKASVSSRETVPSTPHHQVVQISPPSSPSASCVLDMDGAGDGSRGKGGTVGSSEDKPSTGLLEDTGGGLVTPVKQKFKMKLDFKEFPESGSVSDGGRASVRTGGRASVRTGGGRTGERVSVYGPKSADSAGYDYVFHDSDLDEHCQETSPLMGGHPNSAVLKTCLRVVESEGILSSEDDSKKRSKVKFNIGSEFDDTETEQAPKRQPLRQKRRRRRGDSPPLWRRHPGSQHKLSQYYSAGTEPTTPDEALGLLQHDLDDLTSHRFEDAYRRTRIRAGSSACSSITFSTRGEDRQYRTYVRATSAMKKNFDHKPHDVFVELCELKRTAFGAEWKETARWIKYEEDVEGVDGRWGKPHVAFLNFHSLFSLRKGLDRGAVLLDLEEKDLQGIANRVVEYMVACDQIPADQKEAVVNTLLLKHRHVNEGTFRVTRRESRTQLDSDGKLNTVVTTSHDGGSAGNLANNMRASFKRAGIQKVFSAHSIRRHSSFTPGTINRTQSNGSFRERLFSVSPKAEELSTFNPETGEGTQIQESYQNTELLKKLPEGTEATAVLVGAVDFLKQPTIAFVRLAEGVMMENLVEVPIPVRFLFVLLGPYHGEMDYHEVGRSISTLMSDKHFHEVAYRAHSRGQLLSAINEFLNASIVLPPAEWSNTDLIPVDQIREKAQKMMIKNETMRQKRLQAEPVATPAPAVVEEEDEAATTRATLRNPKKPPPREPLKRVGKPFYGVIQDLKNRMPLYLSDIKDGLSGQVVASAIFIFFASLAPAITFGGMYGDKTDQLIGVGETLLVTAINGIILALFSCQPLLIAGATGPLMIFDLSLYTFAKAYDLEYLPMRVWISIWMTLFVAVLSAFEGVTIVKHLTRFTEEIFSTLVCLIFIYGAFEKLGDIFSYHPLKGEYCFEDINHTEIINGTIINGTLYNGTNAMGEVVNFANQAQPNTALLSLILMIGTFIIAFKLKKFRNSKYLGRGVRRALGDFGVPISIVLMVLLDYLIEDTYTDKLAMPDGIQPSDPEFRGWFINPFGMYQPLPVWVIFACGPASMLLFILIFIEENICQLILSKPERNMKKGTGFHWDLFLSCSVNIVSGFLGAPFMTPACVRTVSHASALTIIDTKVAPGESAKIVGAYEQRVSALFVSMLIGLSIFLSGLLNLVPYSVLYGVFLYMGISATAGIQFLERCILIFIPVKHHPNMPFVKLVKTYKMHIYTAVQLLLIVVLWVVKQSPAALCFPFVLMILVPIRMYLLPYFWSPEEIHALDGGVKPNTDPEDEPDFYEQSHNLGQPPPPSSEHTHQT